jgi:hypothetical protein
VRNKSAFRAFLSWLRHSNLIIPSRSGLTHEKEEFETESLAYLICERNGVQSAPENYLADFVKDVTGSLEVDVYQIMRAAGQVETTLHQKPRTETNTTLHLSRKVGRAMVSLPIPVKPLSGMVTSGGLAGSAVITDL